MNLAFQQKLTIPMTQAAINVPYNGFGSVSVDGTNLNMSPKVSTQKTETHSALALLTQTLSTPQKDFMLSFSAETVKQLRTGTPPNAWECFWLFFNYNFDANNKKQTNYIAFKLNGLEIGTANDEVGQKFLYTDANHKAVVGKKSSIILSKVSTALSLSIDGLEVVLPNLPGLYDVPGSIGFYTEDAQVQVS